MEENVLEIILVTEIKCLLPPDLSKGKIVFLNLDGFIKIKISLSSIFEGVGY